MRGRRASDRRDRIYAVVRRIPRGRVATYGQIAALAGMPGHARLVGYALSALPDESAIPWHRVINARGEISVRSAGPGESVAQRLRLEREGVRLDSRSRISLTRFGWQPGNRAGVSTSGRRQQVNRAGVSR